MRLLAGVSYGMNLTGILLLKFSLTTIFYHVNYMIFFSARSDFAFHQDKVLLLYSLSSCKTMPFVTFLHTPKSNCDTLTDSLMINYSSKFVRK